MTHPWHVALMVPINNTTMEGELRAGLPSGTRVTTLKIPRGQGLLTQETIPAYKKQALELAATLAGQPIDMLAYGCTAASFLAGPVGDAELARELAQVVGKPVITTARAMVLALQAVRVNRIALVTPYQDLVNDQLKLFLTESGVDVAAFNSLYAANVDELGKITSDEVARMARATIHEGCDALFIACSQLPTFDILGELGAEFSRPVLSSIQATAWRVRQVLTPLNPSVIPAQAGSL